jgi:hypothetical protein
VGHRSQAPEHGRGVNYYIQSAVPLMDGEAQLVDAIALTEIHGNQGGPAAAGRLDSVVQILQGALGSSDGDHIRPRRAQSQGNGPADTPGCAGDEGDLAGKRHVRHAAPVRIAGCR